MLNVKLSDKQNKSVLSLALATVYRPPGPYTDFLKDSKKIKKKTLCRFPLRPIG